jgi:hypothetical protein
VDLMTGAAPQLKSMRTVLTREMLNAGKSVYATPLTSITVEAALSKTNKMLADGTITSNDAVATFLTNLTQSADNVKSTLGFGMNKNVDLFTTPPLLDDQTDTAEKKQQVAEYRAAVEGFAALVKQVNSQTAGTDSDDVLRELAQDLSDGEIDGQVNGAASTGKVKIAIVKEVIAQDPTKI